MTQRYVVMGVSGCGKSTVAAAIAAHLGGDYIDADQLHPTENVAKMAAGEPLTDADRYPWLDKVGGALAAADRPCVIACSALKRIYRDQIVRVAGGHVTFVYLHGSRDVLWPRMKARQGHYMPVSLLDSQLATLEPPEKDEFAVTVDINQTSYEVIADAIAALSRERA